VWLKCSWIIINMHYRITEEHGGSRPTVENYYHAGVQPHCRKLVQLQKAIVHGAVQRVCIHVYLELGESLWDAAGYLKFYAHHSCLKCENGTRCYCYRDLACRLNSPPSCTLEMQARVRPENFQETLPRLPSLPGQNQITCSDVKFALA